MSYYACADCDYATFFEGGAASHSREKKHSVVERPRPESLAPKPQG